MPRKEVTVVTAALIFCSMLIIYSLHNSKTVLPAWIDTKTIQSTDNNFIQNMGDSGDVIFDVENSLTGDGVLHLSDSNSHLISHISREIILPIPDASPQLSKDWKRVAANGQHGQVPIILNYFNKKRGGFFIEAGAFDGEFLSNTLYLEQEYGWSGLLVEPMVHSFDQMKEKHRNASLLHACFSPKNYALQAKFSTKPHGTLAKIEKQGDEIVQCYPLFSVLLAIGNPRVDFLSLDIEGSEEQVLATVPWDKVDIKSLLVEVAHSDSKAIIKILRDNGYKIQENIYYHDTGKKEVLDIFFVKD